MYTMIGVENKRAGRFSSNLEDGSANLHTSRIVVKILQRYVENVCDVLRVLYC